MRRLKLMLLTLGVFLAGIAAAQSACFQAASNAPLTATVLWSAPTTNTDGTAITLPLTYNLYEGTSATTMTKVLSGITTLTTLVSTGLVRGGTYYFAVSATEGGTQEGAQATPGCKFFPTPTPLAPPGGTTVS